MNLQLIDTFTKSSASGFPKLVEGDLSDVRKPFLFELANGRFVKFENDGSGETFKLLGEDRKRMLTLAYWYFDEDGDKRSNVSAFLPRADYLKWKGDGDPHLELDFEISRRGGIQTITISDRTTSSLDRDRFKQWRNELCDVPDFPDDEDRLRISLSRFFDYAVGSILRGNRPDFSVLDETLKVSMFSKHSVERTDAAVSQYDDFAL